MGFARLVIYCGSLAGAASMAALAVEGKAERGSAWLPANATSHWLHGPSAARVRHLDAIHTAVGLVTHFASAFFWAVPFAAWLSSRPKRSGREILRDALVLGGIAGAVDYGLVPRRVTPGWELALSRKGVAGGFVAMALGLAAGAWLAQDR